MVKILSEYKDGDFGYLANLIRKTRLRSQLSKYIYFYSYILLTIVNFFAQKLLFKYSFYPQLMCVF